MKGSSLMKWTEQVSGPALWAIALTFGLCTLTIGWLAVIRWQQPDLALQVLNLLVLGIAFSVLVWGFWGGVISAGGAAATALVVSIAAGHLSGYSPDFHRLPYLMECLLFVIIAAVCIQFLQREEIEEKADRRHLERLEEEYLSLAIEYGKREDLLKVLEKKRSRLTMLKGLEGRIMKATGPASEAIQVCLTEIAQSMGKGEAEVTLYSAKGMVRYPRGGQPMEIPDGRDEIDRWLEEHRTALLVNNLTHDVRFTPGFGKSRQIMSLVAIPLIKNSDLMGTLRLTSVVPQAFSHEDLRFVSDAAACLVPRLPAGG